MHGLAHSSGAWNLALGHGTRNMDLRFTYDLDTRSIYFQDSTDLDDLDDTSTRDGAWSLDIWTEHIGNTWRLGVGGILGGRTSHLCNHLFT